MISENDYLNHEISRHMDELDSREPEPKYPIFRTDNECHWYMILDENTAIEVASFTRGLYDRAQLVHPSLTLRDPKDVECSEKDFMEKYITVIDKINNLVNSHL
jgi:hypothetical protein